MKEAVDKPRKPICKNRRARHDYQIDETWEAGLALQGSEVKSLRAGKANLSDAYVRVKGNELWLLKAHISPYEAARDGGHEPERERKVLMHRREITRLRIKLRERGFTMIPLELYWSGGRAKVQLGLAKGKRAYDKRHAIAKCEMDRSLAKITRRHQRGR